MLKRSTIKLYDIFLDTVAFRSSIVEMFENLNSEVEELTLDFDRVNYVSRSAAAEILRQKEVFELTHKRVKIISLDKEVSKIFSKAKSNQKPLSYFNYSGTF